MIHKYTYILDIYSLLFLYFSPLANTLPLIKMIFQLNTVKKVVWWIDHGDIINLCNLTTDNDGERRYEHAMHGFVWFGFGWPLPWWSERKNEMK